MCSKFVPTNWIMFVKSLKVVGKWLMADCYISGSVECLCVYVRACGHAYIPSYVHACIPSLLLFAEV